MNNVVYIAAPFASREGLSVEENVARAVALAQLAVEWDMAPLFIHREVAAGMYGRDDVPEERARGLALTRSLAESVGIAGGELWVLELPSGAMSYGCRGEVVAFVAGLFQARIPALHRIQRFRWESGKPVPVVHERIPVSGLREEERGTPQA